MLGSAGRNLILVALILLPLSCARLPDKPMAAGEVLAVEPLLSGDSVPPEWGNLISVTLWLGEYHLWFQDEGGNVRLVVYKVITNQLRTQAMLIQRK
ncbi:MAG: hypothetical protein O6826_04110 [Acidobacteria bacterium]|nr:hypothetical protein [Acidobacteriota bacterium]